MTEDHDEIGGALDLPRLSKTLLKGSGIPYWTCRCSMRV
jgi:hypothetical protein